MRFSYDSTKINPSSIQTNQVTTDETEYFAFEDKFKDVLEMFTIPDDNGSNVIRGIFSFDPPITSTDNEHIVDKDGIGKVINTDGGVLLGKMSFQMTEEVFDVSWFQLVQDSNYSPETGIQVNIDGINHYEKQSVFRFTDKTESKDADLIDLVLSTGEKEGDNPTYKEYPLTPEFEKNTLNYELSLMEYLDNMDIKVTVSDPTSTMKLKVPQRDTDNNLMYEQDGTTIIYEEKEIQNEIPLEFTLNKLGEPDTLVTVIVTAEDGKTQKEYQVVIKRPYGTIKGSIQLGNDLRDKIDQSYGTYVQYIANITVYEKGVFDWDGILPQTSFLDDLDNIPYEAQTQSDKDDGSYTLYVIPGQYDLISERLGFLADVIKGITISENEVIDLGNIILLEGDVDRSGVIDLYDMVKIVEVSDSFVGDGVYDIKYDFGQKGFVSIDDMVSTVINSDNVINIREY